MYSRASDSQVLPNFCSPLRSVRAVFDGCSLVLLLADAMLNIGAAVAAVSSKQVFAVGHKAAGWILNRHLRIPPTRPSRYNSHPHLSHFQGMVVDLARGQCPTDLALQKLKRPICATKFDQ